MTVNYIATRLGDNFTVSSDGHPDLEPGHVRDHMLLTREQAQRLHDSLGEALKVNGVRMLSGGMVEHLGNEVLSPDVDRLRALLRARAEETGFEVALIDTGGNAARPRFVLCWPTGDEVAFSNLVAEVFADTVAAVARMNRERGAGVDRIAAERQRQVTGEGWTAEHDDDEHGRGQLAQAAACYAVATVPHYAGYYPVQWPWSPRWDKRPGKSSDVDARVRALVKAGALCAAEIDRLLRAEAPTVQGKVTE